MATDGLTGGVQCRTAYAHKDDTWGDGIAEIVMETAKRNMMEQLREKYL